MEAATTPATDPVADAKAAKKSALDERTSAKAEAKKMKQAVAKAEQNASKDGLEGDELKAAKASVKDTKDGLKAAEARVAESEKAVEAATQSVKDAQEAEKKRKAEERANRPKKAPLTLSQRRALLNLGDGPVVPKTGFNALPLDHLVEVGLAQKGETSIDEEYVDGKDDDGKPITKTRSVTKAEYSLTDTGEARVKEINPKWKTWKPESTATESATPAEEPTPAAS